MKKNIIFDLGAVLINWDPNIVYQKYFKNEKEMQQFYSETNIFQINKELDRGKPFDSTLAALAEQFPHYKEPIFFWKDKWPEMIGGLIDDSVTILKQLHLLNYSLYAITNWSHETFPYVHTKYKFFEYFRDIVISGKEQIIKPEPQIYQILLQRNKLKPCECIFIDDSLPNVLAARELGIDAIKYENSRQLAKDLKNIGIIYNTSDKYPL